MSFLGQFVEGPVEILRDADIQKLEANGILSRHVDTNGGV